LAIILQIETATKSCSVALAQNGVVLFKKELNEQSVHASAITLFIDEVVKKSKLRYDEIDAIAVSKGPGSYTGLRIGVSTAKGLCYSLDKPLISINTLKAMANGFVIQNNLQNSNALFCPMIDARRMEVYCAVFDDKGIETSGMEAKIIDSDSFVEILGQKKVYFFGDGASKCKEFLSQHANAIIVEDFVNSATDMTKIAFSKFKKKEFENTAYFEPLYLKEFIVLKKNNS
jgi:tRNA threonylcarbamoyladenosine biosynthesis protein TsaB